MRAGPGGISRWSGHVAVQQPKRHGIGEGVRVSTRTPSPFPFTAPSRAQRRGRGSTAGNAPQPPGTLSGQASSPAAQRPRGLPRVLEGYPALTPNPGDCRRRSCPLVRNPPSDAHAYGAGAWQGRSRGTSASALENSHSHLIVVFWADGSLIDEVAIGRSERRLP